LRPAIYHAANRTHELEELGLQLGTEAAAIFAFAAICVAILAALCSTLGSRRDGAGKHSLIPASDDAEAVNMRASSARKHDTSKRDDSVKEQVIDTDDWEELQLRRANQEKARRACIADALPPNALRIGNHLGDMSSQGNGTDVRLFGRNAETRRAQLPTALPVTCTPAFMGFDSTTRSKKVTPTALTFGGTGGS
jgi:hypothetical protein